MYKLLIVLLLLAPKAKTQPSSSTARHIGWGSSLPTACSPTTGDVFFLTSGTKGVYQCLTTNTWTVTGQSPGTGITGLNADTTSTQALSTGTAGTDFAITDPGGGSHVFNLPTASATNTGKLSHTDWSTFNAKQAAITLGTTAQYFRGDLSLATFPTVPTITGSAVLKGSGGNAVAALAADIVSLFSACSGVQYLGADGNCHSAGGAGNQGTFQTVTFSATPTFTGNSNVSTTFSLTLTGNVTSSSFASLSTGQIIRMIFCQDGTGGRTVVFPTNLENFPTVDSRAHYCTSGSGVYDGTNVVVGVSNVYKDDFSLIQSEVPLNGGTSGTTKLIPVGVASGTLTVPARTANLATQLGSTTTNNCAKWDSSGNLVDSGGTCGAGSSGGLVFTSGFTGAGAPNASSGQSSFIAVHGVSFLQNTERNVQLIVHKAGTAGNLCVQTSGTQDASGALTFTLRINGSSSAVVATVAAGATQNEFCSSTTASVSSGDALDIAVANAATATSAFWISTYLEIN